MAVRALGKEPQGNGNSQSESSESRPQSLAPTKPSSTVRGLLGLGRQETGEEVRLFQGESSTQGDLDSIFAKMGESNGRRQVVSKAWKFLPHIVSISYGSLVGLKMPMATTPFTHSIYPSCSSSPPHLLQFCLSLITKSWEQVLENSEACKLAQGCPCSTFQFPSHISGGIKSIVFYPSMSQILDTVCVISY